MIKIIKYGLLFVVIAAAGCSRNGEDPVIGMPLSLSGRAAAAGETAADETLPAGTAVGVWAIDRASGAFNNADDKCNAAYLSDGSENLIASAPVELEIGHDYTIYAYAPRITEGIRLTAGNAVIPVAHATDLLYAPPVHLTSVSGKSHTAPLRFAHRMAQVQFALAADEGYTLPEGISFSVSGFYRSAVMSLTDGIFSERSDAEESVGNRPPELESETVCVIPDEAEQRLSLTVNDKDGPPRTKSFTYRLKAGYSYRFVIHYAASPTLEIIAAVVPWSTIDGGSIDIQG